MRRITEGQYALGFLALLALWLFVALPLLNRPNTAVQHVTQTAEQHSTNQDAKPKKEETDEALAYYTLWLMVFTGILAVATVGLGVATVGLYFTGEKQIRHNAEIAEAQSSDTQAAIALAKQSADAAMLSARAAIAIQLPVIRIRPENLTWGDQRTPHNYRSYCHVNNLTFSNLGATKAFPVEIRYGYSLGDNLPPVPIYRWAESFLPNTIFEPVNNVTPKKRLAGDVEVAQSDWPLVNTGATNLWFFCDFTFEDFMQTRHDVAFCWQWKSMGGGMEWRPDGTPAYNRKT